MWWIWCFHDQIFVVVAAARRVEEGAQEGSPMHGARLLGSLLALALLVAATSQGWYDKALCCCDIRYDGSVLHGRR